MKNLQKVLVLVASVFAIAACDAGVEPGSESQTSEDRAANALKLGKADAPGSCTADSCGAKGNGQCWCDDLCEGYGDCCTNKVATCDEPEPEPCFVGGCSGQYCSDTEGLISTCEWKAEYACFKEEFASCERQDNGQCGWTANEKLDMCLAAPLCKPQLCEMACQNGFVQDANGCELCECVPDPCPLLMPAPCNGGTNEPVYGEDGLCVVAFNCVKDCFATGCGGTMCADSEIVNVWCPEDDVYACYEEDFATCERQDNGDCGWSASEELDTCVDNGGVCAPVLCKMWCQYGWATDPTTGCDICGCAEAPVPTCEPLACKMDCPGGLQSDENGCNICACAEPVGCQGACGGKSDEGCWCDSACSSYGDCCENKKDTCG